MPTARIAAARSSMPVADRTARRAGAAKPAARTSGTLFAFHKLPLRPYLMTVAIFANEVKGKSMLALSRDLGNAIQDPLRSGAQDQGSDAIRGPQDAGGRQG
jgi:hypothetical protein